MAREPHRLLYGREGGGLTMRDNLLLEPSPHAEDAGQLVGRDPRAITAGEWTSAGVPRLTALAAIRAKCLDCCGGHRAEVRKCTARNCPLWPLRMGAYPKGHREASSDGNRHQRRVSPSTAEEVEG